MQKIIVVEAEEIEVSTPRCNECIFHCMEAKTYRLLCNANKQEPQYTIKARSEQGICGPNANMFIAHQC